MIFRSQQVITHLFTFGALCTLVGCTDADARPSVGTVALRLSSDSSSTGSCNIQGVESIPTGDSEAARLANTTTSAVADTLPRTKDGKGGAKVSCTVREVAAGMSYTVTASIDDGINSLSMTGTIPGSGVSLNWYSPRTLDEVRSSECTVQLDEAYEGGGGIRATFRCPNAKLSGQPAVCLASGSFLVEHCAK